MRCKERRRRGNGWPAGISWGLILLALLSPGLAGEAADSPEPGLLEQALATVHDCMARSPAPWPDAWQREYLDTIRRAVTAHPDGAQYRERLAILSKGFQPYWAGLQKGQERSLFEVHCAEIRWYIDSLMDANLPGQEESRVLRNQYKDLLQHGASSLLTQFPFLDPNVVHKAEADHLAQCSHGIEAPLLPIYLRPFSEKEIAQIEQRWHNLRYARVDLWRSLGGEAIMAINKQQVESPLKHPHYVLAQRSLAQLIAGIWPVVARAPEYYVKALRSRDETLKRRE